VRVVTDAESGVPVVVPPIWNLVITATLRHAPTARDQRRLEGALHDVEAAYPYSPAGVFALVAYGLPYFQSYIRPDVFAANLPHMNDGDAAPVLIDALRFPSDPPATLLEENDLVFHLRSDALDQLHDVQRALFARSGTLAGQPAPNADLTALVAVTSVRTGFVGVGLPRRMAEQAQLPFAAKVPDTAPLFMGFASTQRDGQGKEPIIRFDGQRDPITPGANAILPTPYFAGGTSLHLSHLLEDLDGWYALSYDERVKRMFNYAAATTPGRVTLNTLWINPNTTEADAALAQVIGHNEAVQQGSRTDTGQARVLRVDFNTLDALDNGFSDGPVPGVHFLAFTPGSPVFHQSRQGMDAVPIAQQYNIASKANGINGFIHATRRQNFLVPPRAHRAFPLLELSG
jgi:hypothetical protein